MATIFPATAITVSVQFWVKLSKFSSINYFVFCAQKRDTVQSLLSTQKLMFAANLVTMNSVISNSIILGTQILPAVTRWQPRHIPVKCRFLHVKLTLAFVNIFLSRWFLCYTHPSWLYLHLSGLQSLLPEPNLHMAILKSIHSAVCNTLNWHLCFFIAKSTDGYAISWDDSVYFFGPNEGQEWRIH